MSIKYKSLGVAAIAGLSILLSSTFSLAAVVPKGVELAKKQVLNKGNSVEPETLDPNKIQGVPGANIVLDLFEGLVSEKPNNTLTPGMAEKWELSEDGKTYTFYLRQNAKWSDGTPLTAQDFVYSLRRAVDPVTASPSAYMLYAIKNAEAINTGKIKQLSSLGVKAVSDHELQIQLEAPTPYFLDILANPIAFPVKEANVKKYGVQFTQTGHLISNGAYQLKTNDKDKISLVRNPSYWDNQHTIIDEVNYWAITNQNTELDMYRRGQLDYTYLVPSDLYKQLQKESGDELHHSHYLDLYYFAFNLTKSPFKNNLKLRKALSMALDREAMAKYVVTLGSIPRYNIVPDGVKNISPTTYQWSKMDQNDRIKKARQLMKEAGYDANHPLDIEVLTNTFPENKKIAVALQSMWSQVFTPQVIHVKVRMEEWKAYLGSMNTKNFIIVRGEWVADYNDPSAYLSLWSCSSQQNSAGYCNAKYDNVLNEAIHTLDAKKRQTLYDKAQAMVLQDYPIVPVFQKEILHLVKPYVGGYKQTHVLNHVFTKDWYIVKH